MSETQRIHKVVKQWLEHAEEDLRLAKTMGISEGSSEYKMLEYSN